MSEQSFDLNELIPTQNAVTMPLRHPVTGQQIESEHGPMSLEVVGTDSDVFRNRQRTLRNKRLKRNNRQKITADEIEADAIATIVSCTVGFNNIVLDGELIEYNEANAFKLYERLRWVFEQADEFIGERVNFMTA